MQRHPMQDVLGRGVRARICPTCYQRPPGSEADPPNVPRACEPLCPIFLNLPRLVEVSALCASAPVSFEQSVKDLICMRCALTPSSGEYCSEHMARTCPLSRYARDVLGLIETLKISPAQMTQGAADAKGL